jgi:hypothetical protein
MRAGLALLALALIAGSALPAEQGEATLSVEVPAKKWKGVRLKNLPKGTSVALQIQTSGKLRIIVVDSTELRRFPATRALFEGVADTRIGVSVIIPRSADYYVVFDNRTSDEARSVQMKIQARAPRRKERSPAMGDEKLEKT